jgi:hypothetical protein
VIAVRATNTKGEPMPDTEVHQVVAALELEPLAVSDIA